MNKTTAIVLGVAAVLALWAISTYNGLVGRQESVNSAWATVESAYQRRADLVPNLVSTVKGAAKFEKSTLTEITEARAAVGSMKVDRSVLEDPELFKKFEAAQNRLGGALSRLLAVSENYPQLRATETFKDLMVQLEGTENRINVERRNFNETATGYNTAVRRFPAVLVARLSGFTPRPYFKAQEGAENAPKVDFEDR
jgi:LemA protein